MLDVRVARVMWPVALLLISLNLALVWETLGHKGG